MTKDKTGITVEAIISAPIERVWRYWTEPEHIKKWNNAADNWHTPHVANDLKVGGEFSFRMEAKDGSFGFDFGGVYTAVALNKKNRLHHRRRQKSQHYI